MTCTNLFTNVEIKTATSSILSNIHNYTGLENYKPIPNTIFSDLLKKEFESNSLNINTDLNNIDNEGKENLAVIDNNNVYVNCVYQSSLPWYTTSEDKKKCEVIKNIKLPENRLILDEKSSTIKPIFKSTNKNKTGFCSHAANINTAYCENKWYDWIIVPNYYLGNTYYKDNSHYTEADVYKCYAPCKGDYMPYTNPDGELKCIPKKYFSSGIFSNKYIFCAFGLINLIGNIALHPDEKKFKETNLLYILHTLIIEYNIENNIDNELYKINKDMKDYLYTFNGENYNEIYEFLKQSIENNIFVKFSTSSDQDYSNTNEFTYKHRKFNEDEFDMYSFNGLDVTNVLIDPILIHTWILANLFKPLDDIIITDTNINRHITTDDNKKKARETLLYEKLLVIFNDKDKAIRLKNIFFKAVNICYNNKTNFSTNIIEYTKTAFNNETIKNFIIDSNLYIFNSNIWFYYYLYKSNESGGPSNYPFNIETRGDEKVKYNKCIEYLLTQERFDEFIEYKLYKDVEIETLIITYAAANNIYLLDKMEGDDPDTLWKYKYYYSMERLEKPTCPKGYEWNSKYKVCDLIKKKDEIKTDATKDEDDFQIPELNNILYLFFQIILIIIILYIIYVFYDIFSEVVITVLNNIIVYISSMWLNIKNYNTGKANEYDNEVQILKNTKDYYNKKYKTIEDKELIISEYINTHNKPPILPNGTST
jgi:hypothetical protein